MIELYCQHCGHPLKIPDQYAGRTGTCKNCGKKILVPVEGFEPDPVSAPTQKAKDIPYKWIGAAAAITVVLAIGAYAFLGKDSAAPPQVAKSASTSPAVDTPKITPQDPPTSNIAENLSPPSPNFPDFTEGRKYVSLAVDTQSAFTLNPEDMSFNIGERREFFAGLGNIRERPGFSFAFETVDALDFGGETFHTLRFFRRGQAYIDFYTIMRNDGFYFYHYLDDDAPRFFIEFPLKPGMRWSHDIYRDGDGRGTPERQTVTQHYYADAEETIKTPAGAFTCIRELMGDTPPQHDGPDVYANWYAKGFGGNVQVRLADGTVHMMKSVIKP